MNQSEETRVPFPATPKALLRLEGESEEQQPAGESKPDDEAKPADPLADLFKDRTLEMVCGGVFCGSGRPG